MAYYIKTAFERTVKEFNVVCESIQGEVPINSIAVAEAICKLLVNDYQIQQEVREKLLSMEGCEMYRVRFTVVDENGQNVNNHYWYHECRRKK